jgi:hypothetical protein
MARALLPLLAIPWLLASPDRVAVGPPDGARAIEEQGIEDPGTYWSREGFVEMVPPILLPSQDGRERITVRLRIPDGAMLRVAPLLAYPPGTIADRVELRNGDDPGSVVDVRGTTFEASGVEVFHVLRRLDGVGLSGVAWRRDDAPGGLAATDRMLELLAEKRGIAPGSPDPFLRNFERQNDCAFCHEHGKPERRTRAAGPRTGLDEPAPNRGTDLGGLYTVATVLKDSAPLETHRALDMNVGSPYVDVRCQDGTAARIDDERRKRHFRCDDGSVPLATFDMKAALADADAHAAAVCASRGYLLSHMDGEGRATFAAAFEECGLR